MPSAVLFIFMLNVIVLNVIMLNVITLNAIMLNVIMLNIINVIILSVLAPFLEGISTIDLQLETSFVFVANLDKYFNIFIKRRLCVLS
jgi:hypothetical protein